MDESHLPLEAGLEEAISFQKGCYIGQEYVVRLAHRGHVNRKLAGLRLAGREAPTAGSPVLHGAEEAGAVTSAAFSPAFGGVLALAYMRRAYLEPGTEVMVGGVSASVSSLPFPRPS
jgi:folate-binding protein YgfZ